jgi:hypothetical protein
MIHTYIIHTCVHTYIHIHIQDDENGLKKVSNAASPDIESHTLIHTHTYTHTYIHIHTYRMMKTVSKRSQTQRVQTTKSIYIYYNKESNGIRKARE